MTPGSIKLNIKLFHNTPFVTRINQTTTAPDAFNAESLLFPFIRHGILDRTTNISCYRKEQNIYDRTLYQRSLHYALLK